MPAYRRAPARLGAPLLGSIGLVLTGCYTYPPYSGGYQASPGFYSSPPPGVYTPGPAPGMYPAGPPMAPGPGMQPDLGPGSNIPPGGAIPPGGTFAPQPSGSSFPPPGNNYPMAPFPSNGQPTPAAPPPGGNWRGSSSAPPPSNGFDALPPPRTTPRTTPRAAPPGERPVPTYNDDFQNNTQPFQENRRPSGVRDVPPPSGNRGTNPKAFKADDEGQTPFAPGASREAEPIDIDSVASNRATPDGLVATAAVDGPALIPGEAIVLASAVSATTAPSDDHYAHDRETYQWLRGSVDYDETEETWFIIYNLSPDESDRYQGALTLDATEGKLANLKNGDIVHVKGQIDSQQLDRRNAPVFRVEEAQVVHR